MSTNEPRAGAQEPPTTIGLEGPSTAPSQATTLNPVVPGALAAVVLALVIAALLVLGLLRPPETRSAVLAPPGSVLYASFFVDPSMGQKRALDELAERSRLDRLVPDGDLVARAMDPLLASMGLRYERDVQPWLGREAGIAMMQGPGGALHVLTFFEVEDLEVAEARLDALPVETRERTYRDVDYRLARQGPADLSGRWAFGLVDGFLVAANPREAFEAAVDAARGSSLAEDSSFSAAFDPLPDDRLVAAYVSDPALGRELALPTAARAFAAKLLASESAFSLSLYAEPDALVLATPEADPVRLKADVLAALIQNLSGGR